VDILSLTFGARLTSSLPTSSYLVAVGGKPVPPLATVQTHPAAWQLEDRSSVAVIAGKIPCCFMRLSSHLLGRPVLKRFVPHHSLQANPNQRAISGLRALYFQPYS
jgi:hypothetical protein